MADSKIVITAGLDIPDSVNTISKDLYQVRDKLDSDRALKIVCNVDISKTTKRIQSQLDTLSKNLIIKIPEINFGNADKSLGGNEFTPKIKPEIDKKSTAKQVKELEKLLELQLTRGSTKEIRKEIASLLTEYKNALNSNDFSSMQSAFDKLDDYVRQFRKEVELSNDELTKTQLAIKNLARGNKVYISGDDFKEISGLVDGGINASSMLSRAFGIGGWTKDSSKSNISWDSLVQEMNGVFQQGRFDSENDIDSGRFNDHIDGIIQLVEYLNTNLKDNTEYVNHYAEEIEDEWANKLYNSVHKVLGIINDNDLKTFNNDGSFEIITESELEQALQFEKSAELIKRTFVDLTDAKKKYQKLYGVSEKDISASWIKNTNGELSGFSVTVKQAGGIVETFNHALGKTGKLDLKNITGSDKGIAAISREISKAEKDVASFKQSHISILSGLREPLQEVENAINSLKNGTGSIEDFEKAFNTLKTDAAAIGASLKSTGSSFNIFDNAVNKAQNFENTIKSLKMDIESLSASALKNSLSEDIAKVENGFRELQNIENNLGRGQEWADKYGDVSHLIQLIANNLKIAQKENSAFAKEFEKELKAEEKLAAIEEKRVTNAKALAEEQQHDYWQGRFEESIKGLTAENQELKQLKQYYKEINDAAKEFEKTKSNLSKSLSSSINKLNTQSNNSNYFKNSSDPSVIAKAAEIDDLKNKYQALQNELQTAVTPESLVKIKQEFDDLVPEFDKVISSSKIFTNSLKNDSALETHKNKVEKLSATMKAFAQANEKAVSSNKLMSNGNTFADEWQKLNDVMAKGSNLSSNELKHLQERFNTFGKEAEAAGLKGASAWDKFLDSFKTFSTYVSANMILGFIKRQISEMIQEVITLDSAMTNLKKVTDETDTGYDKFIKSAKEQARELHTTVADITTQTSEWAKLGYSLSDARELAKTSMIYSKVGEIDNTTSVGDLVATMKAFNIEADNAITIVDSLNKLGNEFATDSASLGEGLSVSASTLATAGNDLSQSLALLTGGTEITQNANEMGNALRTISLRIRGMKGDLEALNEETDGIESISKIQTQILNLTNNKVNIFDSNNKFRSTYDILKDVAEIYYDLSDPSRADLTEILFGKNRANQGIAILQAFQSGRIEEAYDAAKNSANSAQKEFDKLSEGIESHINDFKGAFESLSETVIDSKLVKTVIDSGTTTLDFLDSIIDKLGVLPILLTTIAGISAFKGVGAFGNSTNGLTDVKNRLTEIADVMKTVTSMGKISKTYKAFNIDLNGLSSNDINALQNYVNLMNKGVESSSAFKQSMIDSSESAKLQAKSFETLNQAYQFGEISSREYTIATKNLSAAQKTATVTSKALSIGLNLLTNIGISIAISAIVKSIEYLATAEERASEKNREFVETTQEVLKNHKQEQENLQGIIDKYTELYTSTNDMTSVKKDLISLQDEIVDKYGEEANAIDLLNGKYSDNIKLLNQERLANAEKFLEDNAAQIRDAKKSKTEKQKSISRILKISDLDEHKEDLDKFALTHNMLISDAGIGGNATVYDLKRDTLDNQIQTLSEFAELLRSFGDDGYNTKYYDKIIEKREELIELQKTDNELLENAAENERIRSELKISPEVESQLSDGLDKLVETQQKLNDLRNDSTEGNNMLIKQKEDEIKSLTSSLFDLAGANTEWRDRITGTLNAAETGAVESATAIEALSQDINEILDGSFKTTLDNVDKLKSAMQTLANGELLSWDEASEIVFDLDTDKTIYGLKQIGEKYKLWGSDYKALIAIKDTQIQKEIELINEQKKAQQDRLKSLNQELTQTKAYLSHSQSTSDANYYKAEIAEIESEMDSVNALIRDDNILIRHLNSQLGDTIDKTEMLKKRQEQLNEQMKKMQDTADNYSKAMTSKIDSVIDSRESEKDVLEKEKEVLNEQLDTLEEQQKTIEDIIDDYKSVVDIVGDVTDKEIDLLKKQQETEENAVQAKIDALKEAREQQEEENTLTEKQLALQEKLRDLEKARQTKVRTYSSERGWHFDVDKEAVANAQTAVDDAQADYDKAVDDKAYNDQLSALEKEKDLITENFEEQIKAYEDYYDEWKSILDEQTKAENEQIAQQILGAEWREKIKNKDTDVLNKFKSNFQGYNTQLNNLINTEIANLKLSIKAKEDEIKAKEKQIQSWKDYKTQVENSINSIKGKYEDYVEFLGQIGLDENSSYEDRERALANFVDMYQGYIDEIQNIQSQLSDINANIYVNTNIPEISEEMANFIENYREGIEAMQRSLEESVTGYGVVNSEWDAKLAKAANALRGYSNGGTVDYTGIAAVHGSKKSAEVVFNAAQSKQLYDMVMKGEFADLAAARAAEGFTSVLKSIESAQTFNKNINNTNNSNTSSIVIQHMDINGVQNPAEFANEFNKNMKHYLQNVYVESLVK